jgi:type II secretory pathway pseudopilin PulG
MQMRVFRSERGVTLIEASIVLAAISVLTAVLAPSINIYIDQARQARAREETKTIADAINEFITDNAVHQFLIFGNDGSCVAAPCASPFHEDANRVNLLVSDGDVPTLAIADTLWTQVVNFAEIGTMADHLVDNAPDNDAANRYRNPSDIIVATPGGNGIDFPRTDSSGFNAPYAWRGAYLQGPVNPDPWGNRYAVNVVFLDPAPEGTLSSPLVPASVALADYPRMDVFVLSAGPDEEVDTRVGQDGAVPGDDDFIHLVSTNAK